MADTHPSTASAGFAIPTGQELYDLLMAKIEPDLVTDQLPLLDAKYAKETPAQIKARAERYEKAFAEYDRQLAEYLGKLKEKVHEFQTTARQSIEHEVKEKEEKKLTSLEDEIQQA